MFDVVNVVIACVEKLLLYKKFVVVTNLFGKVIVWDRFGPVDGTKNMKVDPKKLLT